MSRTHLQATSVHAADDQTSVFEGLDRRGVSQLFESRLRQRLAEGGQFQGVALGVGEMAQAGGDQLDEAGGRLECAAQSPDPVLLAQGSVFKGSSDQLVEEEGITK